MRAGRLNRRITIQQNIETAEASGELVPDWQDIATVYASVTPNAGNESSAGPQELAARTWAFQIRNRSDIDEAMRIVYDGLTFEIVSITPSGRHDEALDIMARSVDLRDI